MDNSEEYVKDFFRKIVGVLGLALIGFLVFGEIVRDIGIDRFVLYFVLPISFLFISSYLRMLRANQKALYAELKILRSEVANIRGGEETIKNA